MWPVWRCHTQSTCCIIIIIIPKWISTSSGFMWLYNCIWHWQIFLRYKTVQNLWQSNKDTVTQFTISEQEVLNSPSEQVQPTARRVQEPHVRSWNSKFRWIRNIHRSWFQVRNNTLGGIPTWEFSVLSRDCCIEVFWIGRDFIAVGHPPLAL